MSDKPYCETIIRPGWIKREYADGSTRYGKPEALDPGFDQGFGSPQRHYTNSSTPSQGLGAATVERCARFLLDRLVDHEVRMTSDDDAREWHGHVTPAMARLREALATDPHQHGGKGA